MRKELYQSILACLKAIKDENEEALFKSIGLWNTESTVVLQPSCLPAVFLECGQTDWKMLGGGTQEALLTLKLHLLTATTDSATTEAATQQALTAFDLSAKAYNALQAMRTNGNGCRNLKRTLSVASFTKEGCMDNTDTYQLLTVEGYNPA